jgi:hypothetical protein
MCTVFELLFQSDNILLYTIYREIAWCVSVHDLVLIAVTALTGATQPLEYN